MNRIQKIYHKACIRLNMMLFKLRHCSSMITFVGTPNIKDFSSIEVGNRSSLTIGSGFTMRHNVALAVRDDANISIGSGVFINRNTVIMSRKSIIIANGVTIGPNVCIYDHDHDIRNRGKYLTDNVIVKDNAWIGANVIILKGVTIGENSVVSAGCIVTKDVPANTMLIQKRTNTIIKI